MEEKGFAKIIWIDLGLPAASCHLGEWEGVPQEVLCPEQPDLPMLLWPTSLN